MRQSRDRPYSAILWITSPRKTYPVLPIRSLVAVSLLAAAFSLITVLVEFGISYLARHGLLNSPDWVLENRKIYEENNKKSKANFSDPRFRTTGITIPPVQKNRKRILIVGDSFVFGDGHTNHNMVWWRQLQWELERRGYHGVDVIAAGLNGASTQDQLRWIKTDKLLELVAPDLVLFGYVTRP